MTRLDFLLLSTSLNLFAACLYRCLDFFIAPAWMFITFLLCGIPLGAIIAQWAYARPEGLSERDELRLMARAVLAVIGLMIITVAVFVPAISAIVYQQLRPMVDSRSFLQGSIMLYFGTLLAEGILFIPFFAGFGMCEFLGYRYVLHRKPQEIRALYVLFLLGVVVAFVLARTLVGRLGATALFVLSLAGMAAFWGRAARRWAAALVCGGLLSLLLAPNLDSYLTSTLLSAKVEMPAVSVWGKYCHLIITQWGGHTEAFYNGRRAWSFPHEGAPPKDYTLSDETAVWLIRPGARIAVLGAGGGGQVKQALSRQPREVVAVEMLSDMMELLRGKWSWTVDDIYRHPLVTTVEMEARRYLDLNQDPFDLIVMASTDSGFTLAKSLFEGHQRLLTKEGIDRLKSSLTADGMIVIRQNGFLRYLKNVLTASGLHVRAYVHKEVDAEGDSRETYYWLFATRKPFGEYPGHERVDRDFEEAGFRAVTQTETVADMPVITDDKPFKGGILLEAVRPRWLIHACFAGFLAICIGFAAAGGYLGPRATSAAARGKYLPLLAFLIGVNFLLVEEFLVISLMPHLRVPMDALYVGIAYFIALACVGSSVVRAQHRWFWSIAAILAVSAAVVWRDAPIAVTLALMAPVVIWTGSLFPALLSLRAAQERLMTVYVQDTVGALVGGVITFGSQLLWGFTVFRLLVGAVVALLAVLLLAAPLEEDDERENHPLGESAADQPDRAIAS